MDKEKKEYSLHDYLNWWGNLSFEQVPFNDVDNLILCELSYVDCSDVLEPMSPTPRKLRAVLHDIFAHDALRVMTVGKNDPDFFRACAKSCRFGNIGISYYRDVFDENRTQFAAMQFELTDLVSYIAFRGTDNSIIGWREDFMTSFTLTPGQKMAADYLKETMNKRRQYYVGGHSKGGNHAVYAVSCLDDDLLSRVLHVYDNDGPGFSKDIFDLDRLGSISYLVTKIVPCYDVIGQLFRRQNVNEKIVASSHSLFLQHDIISWMLDGPKLSLVSSLDPSVKVLNDTFNTWVDQATAKARELFVGDLFDSFVVRGAKRIDDIRLEDIPEIVRSMKESTPETKALLHSLSEIYFQNIGKEAAERVSTMVEKRLKRLRKGEKEKETK